MHVDKYQREYKQVLHTYIVDGTLSSPCLVTNQSLVASLFVIDVFQDKYLSPVRLVSKDFK